MTRYRIYGVDRAGNTWDVAIFDGPQGVLERKADEKQLNPYNLYRIDDPDNEDYGDMEARLQEMADGGGE